MKTKLILFMLLSLFVVQGWATPIDSLDTPSFGNIPAKQWNGVELASGSVQAGLNTKGKVFQDDVSLPFLVTGGDVSVDPCYVEFPSQIVGTPTYQTFRIYENSSHGQISVEMTDSTGMFSIEKIRTVDNSYSYSVPQYQFNENGQIVSSGSSIVYVQRIYTEWKITYTPMLSGIHKTSVSIKKENFGGTSYDEVAVVEIRGVAANPPTPEISVNPSLCDFGTIEIGQKPPKTFTVTGANLTSDLTLSTDNSIFKVSPSTLPPSGGSVTVTYEPNAVGPHNATLTICGGGALEPKYVDLKGTAVNPAPPSVTVDETPINFGTINLGDDPATKTITVTGTNLKGDLNLSITGAFVSMFTAQPYRISPSDAAAGRPVVVTYKPTATGNHTATLVITGGGTDTTKINLSGKCVKPRISVNTTSLDFGSIEVGKEKPLSINVTGTNLTGSITVIKEETHGGQFTISRETLPANGGSVIVTFKPTEAGSFGGRVRISGEGADPVSVSLTGKALELSVYPTSLNFGTTYKNGTVTKKFTVHGDNLTGNVTLLSSDTTIFKVIPKTITPAEAKLGKEVTVTFKPTAGRSYSEEITVSASGVTPKKVAVSGKCAVITPNPTSYNFGNIAVGKPVTKVINVTGTNLTGAMSITLAETEGGQYSINKTTLPASGGTVIVTFKPTDAKTFGASLKISGGSAAAVSVSLTGKGVTPTITRNKSTLTFTGSSITSDYVKITGTNLDDVISLTVTGSTNFTVSPSTISISDAADGKQVKVTCNPKNASSAEAKLKISSPYASTKYVTLKYSRGSSGGGETQICSVEPEGGNEGGNNEFMNGRSLVIMGSSTTDVNELTMNSKVYAEGLNIIIESPVEQKALISDIAGHIREVNLQAGRNEVPVNANGVFIVRIREKTTKLMLK